MTTQSVSLSKAPEFNMAFGQSLNLNTLKVKKNDTFILNLEGSVNYLCAELTHRLSTHQKFEKITGIACKIINS